MSATEKPFITFALLAYNQERFIKEAVEGALAQTYSPLEIILSDDCSTDDTFKIIEEISSEYVGQHHIVLNRNEQNLGISGHINRIMELANGELVVVAAGDDISLPHRTEIIADVWLSKNKADVSIYSSYEVIDEFSSTVREVSFQAEHQVDDALSRISYQVRVVGMSHCWSIGLFEEFGPIQFDAINEDAIIQFRASLLDGVVVVPDVLVKYRLHQSNISKIRSPNAHLSPLQERAYTSLVSHKRTLTCLKNYEKDLKHLIVQGKETFTIELQSVQRKISLWTLRILFAESSLNGRIHCIYIAVKEKYGWKELIRMLFRLPMPRIK